MLSCALPCRATGLGAQTAKRCRLTPCSFRFSASARESQGMRCGRRLPGSCGQPSRGASKLRRWLRDSGYTRELTTDWSSDLALMVSKAPPDSSSTRASSGHVAK